MKNTTFLLFIIAFLTAGPVMADSKIWVWGWPNDHFENMDFEPYLSDAKHPHNSQWNDRNWEPEDWITLRGSETDLVRSLYFADVLRDQYKEDGVPVLEVGPNFYNLGGYDRQRVTKLIDHVYGITEDDDMGIYMLSDWDTGETIGAYTKHGLQLQ